MHFFKTEICLMELLNQQYIITSGYQSKNICYDKK